MSFACAAKLTSFRPKILQAAVAVSRLGLTTMLIHRKKNLRKGGLFMVPWRRLELPLPEATCT